MSRVTLLKVKKWYTLENNWNGREEDATVVYHGECRKCRNFILRQLKIPKALMYTLEQALLDKFRIETTNPDAFRMFRMHHKTQCLD